MANTITIGKYIQTKDEKKDLAWIILEKDNDKALVISRYCIACKLYHDETDRDGSITWESCSIREWLNNDFYQDAFSIEEQSRILDTELTAGNKIIRDKIFLLSKQDLEKYLPEQTDRRAKPTAFAKKGADVYMKGGYCFWYMRDPSDLFIGNSTGVLSDGSFDLYGGDFVMSGNHGVRPAMWIRIDG